MGDDNLPPRVSTAPLEPPKLLSLGEMALAVAIEEIGRGEEGGNNIGPDVWRYTRNPKSSGSWCAAFVSYCFEEAARRLGILLSFKRSNGAKRLYRNIGEAGMLVALPQPGDAVCWHRENDMTPTGKGHIGIVEMLKDDILHTIEGNVGGVPSKVKRFKYAVATSKKMSRIVGYARAPVR